MKNDHTKKKILGIILIIISSFIVGRLTVSKEVKIKYKERIVKVNDLKSKENKSEKRTWKLLLV
jgi:hypothetical protein